MSAVPPFDVRKAIADAYGTLPAGLERSVVAIAVWSGVGIVAVPGTQYLAQQVLLVSPQIAAPVFYAAPYVETLVLLGASMSITIAWHRWLVLNEQGPGRVLPLRDVAAAYVVPFAAFFFLPFIVVPYAMDAVLGVWGEALDPVLYDIVLYGIAAVAAAGFARYALVLAACATGDDLSFRESWSLTAGSSVALFWGMLACRIPLGGVTIWLSDVSSTFASGTLGYVGFYYFASFLEVVTDAVTSAFVAFAYLHFTRDRPSAHDIARHFA